MANPAVLLNAVSANTTSGVLNTSGVFSTITLQAYTTGTVSAFSVQLQGSLDGVNFENVGSAVTAVTFGKDVSTGALLQYFQAVLTGYSGTGTVTCALAYSLGRAASGGGGG